MDDLTDKEKHLIDFLRHHPEVMEKLAALQESVAKPGPVKKAHDPESLEAGYRRAMLVAINAHEMREVARDHLTRAIAEHEAMLNRMRDALLMIDESAARSAELRKDLEAW